MRGKNEQRGWKYYLSYMLWYSIFFAILTAGILFFFLVEKRSLVWQSDGLSLYVPKAYYFIVQMREFLKNLLHGTFSFPVYDFVFGMGDVVPFHLEPMYWLYLLFAPAKVELAFDVVFIARYYVAGLSVSLFLFYFKNGRMAAMIASFAYIYCSYAIWSGFRHSHFIIPMIMLPLCLLAMEEIYRKKRWYLCTILVWIHLWCGYYYLYMDTIAMGVYFLIRFFANKEGRTVKEFLLRMRTIICSYLLGVGIGNFTLVNSFSAYLNSSRAAEVSSVNWADYLSYGWKRPVSLLYYFTVAGTSSGSGMRLGFIPLIYVAVVVLFLRKGRKELKSAFLTGLAFCMIPAVAYVFSGFDSLTYRWSYIYAFALVVILAYTLRDLCSLTKKELGIVALSTVPLWCAYIWNILLKEAQMKCLMGISAGAMLLTLAVLCFLNLRGRGASLRIKQGALLAVAILSLWGTGYQELGPAAGNLAAEFVSSGQVLETIKNTPLAAAQDIEDDSFYRVTAKLNHVLRGSSQVYGYYGTAYDSSTTKKNCHDYYRAMGLTSWYMVRMWGYDGRTFMDALAAVKYYVISAGKEKNLPYGYEKLMDTEKNGKAYEIYENTLALPLAYTYDSVISKEKLEEYPTMQRQEIMLQAAILENTDLAETEEAAEDALQVTGQEVPVKNIICENVSMEDHTVYATPGDGETATITLEFDGIANSEVYICIHGMERQSTGRVKITYSSGDYSSYYLSYEKGNAYDINQPELMMNVGYHEEAVTSATLSFSSEIAFGYDDITVFCQPVGHLQEYTDRLKEDTLENVQMGADSIKGEITLDKEKLLVFSVPYQRGWRAYVDGEETEITKVNYMYMGIDLTEGEHTVELRYSIPGIHISQMISAVSLVIFAVALVIRRKRKNAAQYHHSVL